MLLACPAFAEDLHSFCFASTVDLGEVQRSLSILLLPRDIVDLRKKDNCLDIITSPDRGKLFEKFLIKRYDLKKDVRPVLDSESEGVCQLNVRTTSHVQKKEEVIKAGEKNKAQQSEKKSESASTMELLVGAGVTSEFSAYGRSMKVICYPTGGDSASLTFFYDDTGKVKVGTQLLLKKGEWLNLASIKNDLDEKIRTLGMPQSEWSKESGLSETIYELQYK